MSLRSFNLNLACPKIWKKDAINICSYSLDVPDGYDFLRADPLDLEHYFFPCSVDEFILPPFNTDGLNAIINRLLKPGGKVTREFPGTPNPKMHDPATYGC